MQPPFFSLPYRSQSPFSPSCAHHRRLNVYIYDYCVRVASAKPHRSSSMKPPSPPRPSSRSTRCRACSSSECSPWDVASPSSPSRFGAMCGWLRSCVSDLCLAGGGVSSGHCLRPRTRRGLRGCAVVHSGESRSYLVGRHRPCSPYPIFCAHSLRRKISLKNCLK